MCKFQIVYITGLSCFVIRKKNFNIHFPSVDRISSLRIPILIMHGSRDGTIPVEHGRRLYEVAASGSADGKERVRYWEVPGAGHNSVGSSKGWTETIRQFLKDVEGK